MIFTSLRNSLILIILTVNAHAATAQDILIGQTTDLSSLAGSQMHDYNEGAQLVFHAVNASGGLNGRHIKLVSLDDAYGAPAAQKNAEKLAANPNILAFFGSRGSNPTDEVIKVADREQIVLVAPVNGADSVRKSKYVFPVRASYKNEIDAILKYYSVMHTQLAVLVQDDKFGQPLFAYIKERLADPKLSSVSLVGGITFGRRADELTEAAGKILALKPSAVIALCNPTACAQFLISLHNKTAAERALRPAVAQLSNIDMLDQLKVIGGANMSGNPFTQVMPDPRCGQFVACRDFVAAATKAKVDINYRTFEGYISALVLVEGMRRSKSMTRQGIKDGLESLGSIKIGGFIIDYSPTQHLGSTYVELVSFDKYGRVLH